MKTKSAFCSNCQENREHQVVIDNNNDMVFTCSVCERFFKVPTEDLDKTKLVKVLDERQTLNEGQISVEALEAQQDEILDSLLG